MTNLSHQSFVLFRLFTLAFSAFWKPQPVGGVPIITPRATLGIDASNPGEAGVGANVRPDIGRARRELQLTVVVVPGLEKVAILAKINERVSVDVGTPVGLLEAIIAARFRRPDRSCAVTWAMSRADIGRERPAHSWSVCCGETSDCDTR